jgi:TonB family protein
MRVMIRLLAIVLAIGLTGCASPPTADVDAAKAAVDKASADQADKYAAASMRAAQDARAALDAELKVQEGKMVKSYDKTKELAAAAKGAGEKASTEAAAAKEKADAVVAAREKAAAARARAIKAAVRPGGRIMAPKKIKDVPPVYPPLARTARVSGPVTVEATIGTDGKVVDAKVVKSIALLDQAALDAVQQWEYLPTMLNGTPVPVTITVTVNFTQ